MGRTGFMGRPGLMGLTDFTSAVPGHSKVYYRLYAGSLMGRTGFMGLMGLMGRTGAETGAESGHTLIDP